MGRPKGAKNKDPNIAFRAAKNRGKMSYRKGGKKSAKTIKANKQVAAEEAERIRKRDHPTKEELITQIYRQLEANPMVWGHYFFQRHFRMKTPAFHVDIIRAAMRHRHVAIAAPRESSKSTLLNFLYPFHGIMFKRFHFIILLSNTFKKAAMALDTIKNELKDNEKLKASLAVPIQITKDAEGDSEFRHPGGYMVKVLCKGVDQIGSIRGVKFGAYRPDLIIVDDVEDDELVKNPMRRQELQNNVDEALMPAGEAEKCQFIWIGTILHDDSQLAKLVIHEGKYNEYHKMFYQAHLNVKTDHESSLWPEKWTVERLNELMADKPLVYAKEYQNDPVAGRAQLFQEEDFRYWKAEHGRYWLFDRNSVQAIGSGSLLDCKAAIACDLAWEDKRMADYTVILPGFLTPQSEILVWPYIAKKGMRPYEIEEILFHLVARLEALTRSRVPIGMEKAKLEKVMRWMLREAMKRRNKWLILKDLIWDGDKIQRVEVRLSARYNQHAIFHQQGMGELEHQLLRFPSAAHDDLPDALQGLVQMLQFPKGMKKQAEPDDLFMQLRKFAKMSRKAPFSSATIGKFQIKKTRADIVPAQWSPLG